MRDADALDRIHMQIMWDRLLAIVEEQAQTLVRTAFSTTVREAGDLSSGVFDTAGRMLAQAVTGTPGHVNAMAASVGFFLDKHPIGYPSASDPTGRLPSQFGLETMPTSYLIDAGGVIRYVHPGFKKGDGSKLREEIRSLLKKSEMAKK